MKKLSDDLLPSFTISGLTFQPVVELPGDVPGVGEGSITVLMKKSTPKLIVLKVSSMVASLDIKSSSLTKMIWTSG
jgi:hypothetical protein